MRSLWNDREASTFTGDLGPRIYTSRLLGRDKSLVLHGGGNTSVKLKQRDITGEEQDILAVKGSGWDLEFIEAKGFAPVRMSHVLKLAGLKELSDPQMVNELKAAMTLASAPAPSVETILHAILPYRYVDHTHADAVLTVTNTANGEERIRDIYSDKVIIVPYIMPGFDLARLCYREYPRQINKNTIGMVLLKHGIFSFGESAQESYLRMIHLVGLAEKYLGRGRRAKPPVVRKSTDQRALGLDIARLRSDVSQYAGRPMLVATHQDQPSVVFSRRRDIGKVSQQGPVTPDHVLRTKRVPLVGRNVAAYAATYRKYFNAHKPRAKSGVTMLDPAPRVILDHELGLCTVGKSASEAAIVSDIYQRSIAVIEGAQRLGGYRALSPAHLFDVEYWDLEQAKLKTGTEPPVLSGEIAIVTGAASGIGKACVASLLKRGAAVIGLDISPAITKLHARKDYLGLICDVTDKRQIADALEHGVRAFGGLDMLVLNAGIFPGGTQIAKLSDHEWQRVLHINLDANMMLMRACHPFLKLAPSGGRVVVIGSKNVPAPGPGAAAYSASKAALCQFARVAALEWGVDNIRVNIIHPNAVFDTGIWTEEVLSARAANYHMSVAQYKKHNVLNVEVTSHDVGELAAEMCGPLFAKTTGAQVPVDGGNERVI